MVLEDVPVTIRNVYDRVRVGNPEYIDMMISPEKAYDICRDTSLVILVDNSRKLSTEAPYLLDVTSKIVVVDHHRIGKDFVEKELSGGDNYLVFAVIQAITFAAGVYIILSGV